MGRYTNCTCDHCGKKLTDDDDIVICPVCGAPQHRSCYFEHNACAHEAEHANGYEWKFPTQGDGAKLACPHCGAQNPANATQCQLCGAPLKENGSGFFGGNTASDEHHSTGYSYNAASSRTSDFTVDDVKSEEISAYYGDASRNLMPKFTAILQKKFSLSTLNIPAFILGPYYLLYRKLKKPAYILMAVLLVIQLTNLFYSIELVKSYFLPQMFNITVAYSETLLRVSATLASIAQGLRIALHVFCGFNANRFLLMGAIDNIKEMHTRYAPAERDGNEYHQALWYCGRPSVIRPILWAIAFFAVNYVIVYAVVLPLIPS